jgi:hypothetical protein
MRNIIKNEGDVDMKKLTYKIIYWSSRILSFALLIFMFLFSLDVFEIEATLWNQLLGLLMHNIPLLILLLSIIMGWKLEIIPAITFMIASITLVVMSLLNDNITSILFIFPLIIPGIVVSILFFCSWFYKKKVIAE